MRRAHLPENLPEFISELVFVALLVVGVLLFFLWATRPRPLERSGARRELSPAPASADGAAEGSEQIALSA